jgi:hypothetical protein
MPPNSLRHGLRHAERQNGMPLPLCGMACGMANGMG